MTDGPFVPTSNAQLRPGHFWSIPLSDGRYACGRVLAIPPDGPRTMFVGAVLDWVGDEPPTERSIAEARILVSSVFEDRDTPRARVGHLHLRAIRVAGGAVLGERPLELDGIGPPDEEPAHWGMAVPLVIAEHRFVEGDPPRASERREVQSPFTDHMLRPAIAERGVIQFCRLPADDDLVRLAEWLEHHPGFMLRAYASYDRRITDLEFLRFFPSLKRFAAEHLYDSLTSLDGLRHLPTDVAELGVGATRRPLDLSILARFPDLRILTIEGPARHLEVIATLTRLEAVTLRSVTLPDLSPLLPLRDLRSLDLKLGGTRDLSLLPRIGRLRYLELWMVKGLVDVSAIGGLPELRSLFLQALPRVESLPDLGDCVTLRSIKLQAMKGLRDLRPLATAPALEQLEITDMRHLEPEDLRPLVGHPRLRAASVHLGSDRKDDAVEEMLALRPVVGELDWRVD